MVLRVEALMKACARGVTAIIHFNEHNAQYVSIVEHIQELIDLGSIDLGDLPEGWRQWRSLVCVQIYPDTLVGSVSYYGETLDQIAKQMEEAP